MTQLHFHLGPVQPFIAAARRTRDIWAGSFILSWLSARAAAAALGDREIELLQPLSAKKDAVFLAARAFRQGTKPAVAPFLGTFPNHFCLSGADETDEAAAVAAVREGWVALAGAVESLIFDTEVDGQSLGELHPEARENFQCQIGTEKATPFWEVYTVRVDEIKWKATFPEREMSPLAARKTQRWSADMAALPARESGAFCSMIAGWTEISGFHDRSSEHEREACASFWECVRAAAVHHRYDKVGSRANAFECLDLRANERLSAPALVKRLFPLIKAPDLERIIGWNPVIRSCAIETWLNDDVAGDGADTNAPPGWKNRFFRFMRLVSPPPPEMVTQIISEVVVASGEGVHQEPALWPSTSFVAATHWLADVQRLAPEKAKKLSRLLNELGPHVSRAERSLFIRAVHAEGTTALAFADGAHFFQTTIERESKLCAAEKKGVYANIAKCLQSIADVEDPGEKGRQLGAPSPVYAIVRADADHMGDAIAAFPELSDALADFTTALRFGKGDSVGKIADHNGVTLYASADEMIALCPIEDALDLALDVRKLFLETMKKAAETANREDMKAATLGLTLSVAITFAHRQAPLTWILQSGAKLLDLVAKEITGRNALAIEILDAGGRRVEWAAPFSDPSHGPIASLREFLQAAVLDARPLGGNPFLHDVAEKCSALFCPEENGGVGRRIVILDQIARQDRILTASGHPILATDVVARPLLAYVVKHALERTKICRERQAELTDHLLAISWTYRVYAQSPILDRSRLSLSGLKIVRFLAGNWRRIERSLPTASEAQ